MMSLGGLGLIGTCIFAGVLVWFAYTQIKK
ncbi:hypothetical protein PQE68_gp125 [Bacillus phage vB_BanS_Sophrita]|uniref:Uncharacterized protein n=1 Tax=Bacillus phage vB_BanS_Sophrita TaxID=2894790 RepID=A0AAE9CE38_9CAUD|nr:hypothetical protein PQE68_gp125 [Bacillus phage vB_BanS_Sophrita]UGO50716.1 hypothetical protein SOPHRITA_125 [Bacillus phage vB_BanS_Sophrita]